MTAQHTLGPWAYRPAEFDDWGVVRGPAYVGHFYGPIICQARDPYASDGLTLARHREAGTDPWEANARLIAAAPEMAELIRVFSDALGSIADTDKVRWPDNQTIEHSGAAEEITWGDLRKARALLAKINAQGIEAGTGETEGLDAKRESPVGSADAPKDNHHDPRYSGG